MLTVLHAPIPTDSDSESVPFTSNEMMKADPLIIYQPINHEVTFPFTLWESEIQAALIKKSTKKRSEK